MSLIDEIMLLNAPINLVMDEKKRKGKLIVFEGIDGTGKTTQIKHLALALEKRSYTVVATREPTDGVFGRKIRELYVSREGVSPADELELFLADRREHVSQVINPALAEGKIVLTDRYYLSTAAYQGAAGMDYLEIIAANEKFAPRPDLVLLLDIAVSASVQRIQDLRQESLNAFEQEDNLTKVDRIFKAMVYSYIKTIDGSQSVGAVHNSVMTYVDDLLK